MTTPTTAADAHQRDTVLDRLEQLVEDLSVESHELDEIVRDCLHRLASQTVNDTADDETFWAIYDAEHDAADDRAAHIDNAGTRAQLAELLNHLTETELIDHLHDPARAPSDPEPRIVDGRHRPAPDANPLS